MAIWRTKNESEEESEVENDSDWDTQYEPIWIDQTHRAQVAQSILITEITIRTNVSDIGKCVREKGKNVYATANAVNWNA